MQSTDYNELYTSREEVNGILITGDVSCLEKRVCSATSNTNLSELATRITIDDNESEVCD